MANCGDSKLMPKEWDNAADEIASLKKQNAELIAKLIEAEHSLQHALSAINDALTATEMELHNANHDIRPAKT